MAPKPPRRQGQSSYSGAHPSSSSGAHPSSSSGAFPYAGSDHMVWGEVLQESGSSGSSQNLDRQERNWNNVIVMSESESYGSSGTSARSDIAADPRIAEERSSIAGAASASPPSQNFRDLPVEAVEAMVPRGEDGSLMSIGSMHHGKKPCVPCAFYQRPSGCREGLYCEFCHHKHAEVYEAGSKEDEDSRPGPRKGQRLRYKKNLGLLKEELAVDPEPEVMKKLQSLPDTLPNNRLRADAHLKSLKEAVQHVKALRAADQYQEGKNRFSL